eukprot:751171-Hanusia_phi.AAC.1
MSEGWVEDPRVLRRPPVYLPQSSPPFRIPIGGVGGHERFISVGADVIRTSRRLPASPLTLSDWHNSLAAVTDS